MKVKVALVRIIVQLAFASGVAYITVGSLLPWEVYLRNAGWLARIGVTVALAFTIAQAVAIFQYSLIVLFVRGASRMPAGDVRCACHGAPLLATIGQYGMPVQCPRCNRMWHLNSFNADVEGSLARRRLTPCAMCRQQDSARPIEVFGIGPGGRF